MRTQEAMASMKGYPQGAPLLWLNGRAKASHGRGSPLRVPWWSALIGLFLFLTFTAAGASPLATQTARVGLYQVLLNFYSLPRAGQAVSMTIESNTPGVILGFSQAILKPAPSTDANTIGVMLRPDKDTKGAYDVTMTPPIRGLWLLHLTVTGPSGSLIGDIPIDVAGPPVIPTWLGWMIGLLPLPLLILFIWLQVGWRKTQRQQVHKEMLQRPSL